LIYWDEKPILDSYYSKIDFYILRYEQKKIFLHQIPEIYSSGG
jgi:hypothetical protein